MIYSVKVGFKGVCITSVHADTPEEAIEKAKYRMSSAPLPHVERKNDVYEIIATFPE